MNKLILCMLSLFFSNFVFAQDLLIKAKNVPERSLIGIILSNPLSFTLFFIFAFLFYKHSSK